MQYVMKKTKNGTLSASQKTSIELREYGPPASISLSSQEYDILSKYFGKCLEITLDKTRSTLNNYICSIKAKDYIGNINLPSLMLRINPKIKKLNINYMIPLAYDLEPFKESDFGYLLEKESTLFELLVKKLSDII